MLRQYVESFWPLKDVHPSGEPVGKPQRVTDGWMLGDVLKSCTTNDRTFQLQREHFGLFVLIKWCQRFMFDAVCGNDVRHLPGELGDHFLLGKSSCWGAY